LEFSDKGDAYRNWKAGRPMAIVLSDRSLAKFREVVGPVTPTLDSGELRDKNERRYYLFLRN
jgi:hypothetical protein